MLIDLFIYTSQLVKFFLSPLNHVFWLCIPVLGWQSKWKGRYWRRIGQLSALWIVLLFSPLFSIGLFYYERMTPTPPLEMIKGKSALVLSGGTALYHHPTGRYRWFENPDRVMQPLRLYKQGVLKSLIFTGGQIFALSSDWESEAKTIGQWWQEMGVAAGDIILEENARNTFENFQLSLPLFSARDFVLISSAFHLPRAMMVAHKFGLNNVIAYPVDYKMTKLNSISWWGWENVQNAHRLIFEVVGVMAYLVTGQGS